MLTVLETEFIYVFYYFKIQLFQIAGYWALGILIGSAVSVFAKEKIHSAVKLISEEKYGVFGIIPASLLGIASPLCLYGTIPLAYSFSEYGIQEDFLAAFMMSSILLNPQLIIYSTALGAKALLIRIISAFLCGIVAGLLVRYCFKKKSFFNFSGFSEMHNHDTDPSIFKRFFKNVYRNIRATGPMFLLGIFLSALFQRYVPQEGFAALFGGDGKFGVLMAATIGVPLYACGGGTIPLLQQWLGNGMSMGSAAAFMITGPATKITNLGALKIVLGIRNFIIYLAFVMLFSVATGLIVNVI
ncbi:MAG: permease [Clostridia bacterium]|nr:permease [Clostridia bacterium]